MNHTLALLAKAADHEMRLVQAEAVCTMMEMRPDLAAQLIPRLRLAVDNPPPLGGHRAPVVAPGRGIRKDHPRGRIRSLDADPDDAAPDPRPDTPPWPELTDTQLHTLQAVADHPTPATLAAHLEMTDHGVGKRVSKLLHAVGVDSRVELMVRAFRAGAIQ